MESKEILMEAARHWMAMSDFRQQRRRCKDYTYGRQWNDTVVVDGNRMREEDYIRQQGNIPLKNNLIRRIVRNVLGVFRNQYSLPGMSDLHIEPGSEEERRYRGLIEDASAENLFELYCRTMEEFLISGLAVHRKRLVRRGARLRVATETVGADSFFLDSEMRDFRGLDVSAVGQIHDVAFSTLCSRFARHVDDVSRLRAIYTAATPDALASGFRSFGMPGDRVIDFLTPTAAGACRVVEYWRKETREVYRCHDTRRGEIYKICKEDYPELVEAENMRRGKLHRRQGRPLHGGGFIEAEWMIEEVWRYYFLAPTGETLCSGESPYGHGGHPYVFKAYPYIDGEIQSFVADCIDQQRYINRLITLYDWIMRASAKGVLLFPEGALPEDVDIDDISEEWSRFNGVIVFRPKAGMPLPQQVSSNATNIGITDLLQVQLKMMEDVSGVNSALQGNIESGAVSGTLYNMQIRNAMTGLLDMLESYASFMRDASRLEMGLTPLPDRCRAAEGGGGLCR